MFFGVGVGTLLYNEQAAIVRQFYPDDEARTAYYANIDLAVNALTLFVQVFLTRAVAVALRHCAGAADPGVAIISGSPRWRRRRCRCWWRWCRW